MPDAPRGRAALDAALATSKTRRSKYGVAAPKDRVADGILFASKREMQHYQDLVLARRATGEDAVHYFLRQVSIYLPGGVRFVVDFVVFFLDGRVEYHEVKGRRTETYNVKKRLVEACYPIQIQEIE